MPYACQASPTELSSTDSESENESGAALIIEISDDEDEAEALSCWLRTKLVFVGGCLMIFDTGTTTEGHSKASCAWATRHQAKVAPQAQEQNSCRIQVDVFRSMQAANCAEICPERSAGRATCTRNDEEQRTHTAKAVTHCVGNIFLGNSRWKGSR